ncbi:hypothetical protein XENTR_v10002214 [Xenopus tropicalis]|nr:hypothetical protein XENTR_v10002214 [Xenopus tropicalis]
MGREKIKHSMLQNKAGGEWKHVPHRKVLEQQGHTLWVVSGSGNAENYYIRLTYWQKNCGKASPGELGKSLCA